MKKLNYKGKGEHSVNELELIINQQAEELHLLNIEKPKQLLIQRVSGSALLNDLIKEGEEVIAINGLRFTGTHEEKIKQVFDKHGIKYESQF